jgi:CxxC motif-containing protein
MITVEIEDGVVARIAGNQCPRGEAYVRQEAIDPMRMLPTSVKVIAGVRPLVSVKTDRPVPKRSIAEIMDFVRTLSVEAPVEIGQVIAERILGTEANLVATRSVARTREW